MTRRQLARVGLVAIVCAAIGLTVSSATHRNREPSVASISLPRSWSITRISSIDGHPELFAEKERSASRSSNPDDGSCELFVVGDDPLRLSASRRVACDAASDPGARTALVIDYVRGPYGMQAHVALIRPNGAASVGPTLMDIPFVSDTRPVWAEGGGSDWLYDVATPSGPLLLQISPTTGRVERRIPMPKLYRPLMVADASGLWIGLTPGGSSGGPTPSAIYFVSSTSGRPVVAWRGGASDAWAYAHADRVLFEVNYLQGGDFRQRLVRFDGGRLNPAANVSLAHSDFGGSVFGDSAAALYMLTSPNSTTGFGAGCGSAELSRLDSSTGRVHLVARLPAGPTSYFDGCGGLIDGQGLALAGRVYLLTGQSSGPASGFGRLYSLVG